MQREEINFIFQHCDAKLLDALYVKIDSAHPVKVLQAPSSQTLLQPVIDPVSGSEFYSGEILVTTTIVQVGEHRGWAMVMDDNERLSFNIAVIDACFGGGLYVEEITELAQDIIREMKQKREKINQKAHSSRVDFDLM